jgi:hypothetical protein
MKVLSSFARFAKFLFILICLGISNTGSMQAMTMADGPYQPSTRSDALVEPACVPTITFTHKPSFGSAPPFASSDQYTLRGRVDCVANPSDYKVAVFIYIPGWWVKPNFANPLAAVNSDGTWNAIVYTCCSDNLAVKYAAFLYHNNDVASVSPFLAVGGNATLPNELYTYSQDVLMEDRLRTIEFSGYTWNVKESNGTQVGPGNNYFSSDANDVWVDGSGNLHLTISQKNGKWYSTEVFTQVPLGYGTYTFVTASPIDQLDKNAVLGLFTWDDDAPPNYRELDIEFSRWGEDLAENSQFVVQPHDQPGNRHRFYTTLTGVYSTHGVKWEKDKVDFFSNQGYPPTLGNEIEIWPYAGPNIPAPGGAVNARINLWLFNGVPPSNGQKVEVVIKSFSHVSVPTAFGDVPPYYWAWDYIERLYKAGITGGCSSSPSLIYCPENEVTRAQMAVFLEKGTHYPSAFSPPDVPPTFNDTAGHWAEDWIEALKSDGITSGCATGLYCPDSAVTRAQMAVFLLKAKHGASYSPPAATGTFADVPVGYWADKWIEQLAAEGITSGCATGLYCPENPVTRAQMAVFLVKAFSLP